MASRMRRVLSFDEEGGAGEEDERKPPAKRQRLHEIVDNSSDAAASICLLELNDNCLLHILSKLHFNDLNNVAMCNRYLNRLRAHESLSQKRTATVICQENSTTHSFATSFLRNNWNSELTGNKSHMRIEHVERITYHGSRDYDEVRRWAARAALTNIRSLDCSLSSQNTDESVSYHAMSCISLLLPNLDQAS